MSLDSTLPDWLADPLIQKWVTVAIGIFVIYAIANLLRRSVSRRFESTDARYKARKYISFLAYLAIMVLIISIFSDKIGQFNVALGVMGAGIAFALQEVIASFAGWIAISLGGFYKPGDRVQVGGIKGDVIDIGVLRTTLMEIGEWVQADLYNGRIVRVANSFVFKEPVFNYSTEFPFLWDEISIGIKYGSDYILARNILEHVGDNVVGDYARQAEITWNKMVRKFRLDETKVTPVVTLAANENWVQYTLRYVVDYKLRRITKDKLYTKLLEEIGKMPDRVKIASSTIEISNLPK